ncbi:hypothetical protein HPB52_023907 [Rhipicephalus sanguineus]|uniref:AMP-dependent synthetase/ligase domain-containing protein n=2 Tax=Rhipicephalus sanguineus TaxID=34632 RepID=A0A9D4T4Z0_RHISA|nr:hypothetical protein HPB52_023907 [Rhipicephalus sanguineus]
MELSTSSESDASASEVERSQRCAPWLEFGPTMCGMLASLEEQVQRRPQQAATLYRGRRRTFADIDRCSARMAEALRAPPDFAEPADVAACTAAPDDTLLAFLACLRLSACCTPIRPSASNALLASIMEELPPACTVVDNDTASRFAQARDNRTLNINDALQPRDDGSGCWDRPWLRRSPSPSRSSPYRRPLLQILGEDEDGRCALAAERCLGRIQWEWSDNQADRETVAVLDSVDTARFWEDTLSALCAGATVALPTEEDKRSPSALLWFLRNASATRVEMTPDLLFALLRRAALDPGPVLPELRLVKCSRGLVTTQLARLFQRILPKARLMRVYERSGHSFAYECPAQGELRHFATDHGDFVTIGRPVGNCRAAVCEPRLMTECLPGTVGTICFAGAKDDHLLPTGDKGFVDSDGYFYLTERTAPRIDGCKADIALITKCLTDIPVVSDGEVSWERLSSPKVSLVAFYWSTAPGDTSGELFRPLSSKLPGWQWMPLLVPLGPLPADKRPDKRELLRNYADAILKLQSCGEVNVTRAATVLVALARSLGTTVGQLDMDRSYASQRTGNGARSVSDAAALLEHIGYQVSASELSDTVPLRILVERAACTMMLPGMPGARRLRVSLLDADTSFDEVTNLLARSFTSKNRLDQAVHNTEEQHWRSLRHLWPQLIADGATRLVRDAETGKLLAVAACCDFSAPQTAPDGMAESFLAIAEINESMERPLRAAVTALGRRLLLWFMVGTGTDLHADNIALVLLLMANTLRDAKSLGYHGVCSINSHLITNVITQQWFQFDVFDEGPVADFEYCGRRPFANIRAGTHITSVCRFFDPS